MFFPLPPLWASKGYCAGSQANWHVTPRLGHVPQERKVVTVLFADIVDSSATARSYDAEVLRAALARMFARTREILVAHGATVEKFIGDAVMAGFGGPGAHGGGPGGAGRGAPPLPGRGAPKR